MTVNSILHLIFHYSPRLLGCGFPVAVVSIDEHGECRVLDLARHFNVSHVTVSRIVKRLQEEKLLSSQPYRPVELTAKEPGWPGK